MTPASIGCIAAFAVCLAVAPRSAVAAEDQVQTPPAPPRASGIEADAAESATDVKKLFAAQCGWCHADYGMKEGKAPRLAGTRMTEKQVADRIRNGKTDAMPGFRRTLTEEQIQAFTQYIKGLKVPE